MNELIEFILGYDLIYRKWDAKTFRDWLQWHCDHQLLLKAIDLDGSIAGVLIIRTVMKPQDANQFYAYDPEGDVAYVELAIAKRLEVFRALALAGLKRFGERPWIAWKRPPYFVTKFRETKRVLGKIFGGRVYV
jgi:hypothetical protein